MDKKGFFRLRFLFPACLAALLLAAGSFSVFGKSAGTFAPAGKTVSCPEQLKQVRSSMPGMLDSTGVASIVVAVAKDGVILWEEGFGWANREKEMEATPHSIYPLASISKSLTATGLMVLEAKGLVDLDEPANRYLGESKLIAHAGSAEDATLKRLLFHTSGLPQHWNIFDARGSYRRPSMDESIRRYGILVTAPGEIYNYSNFGFGVIDHVISRVSGTDYAEFMKREVFEPLGLTRTSVMIDTTLEDLVAQMYDERNRPISPYDFDHRGASAVLSTAHDLVRYGLFHLKNRIPGQKPILKDETLDRLHTETDSGFPELEKSIGYEYLLGSFGGVDIGEYRIEVCTGSMPGASSRLALVPEENLVTVLLCNGDNIDLWKIEGSLIGSMLPGFREAFETELKDRREESVMSPQPPPAFIGSWSGGVLTYAGEVPVELNISGGGQVKMTMRGVAVQYLPMKTPLGEMGFQAELFKGLFLGRFDTPDAARAPHVILVECRMRDNRLTGYAAAVAMNKSFCLPYWMELGKAISGNQ
ncbi:MAG: beta-lactamase family protein [Candidatus Krumholzibacteriota bacterium]|nr:beta-lactamase family protein [Candidatus Krumholzibacteriota bacterium]